MKRLPLHRRPVFAKRVLEIGGGHAPYAGVTHAVDKFPDDNSQRAAGLLVPQGVEFKQGDLEAIPFDSEPKFDFLYASHVLEHVSAPEKAVAEINRIARRGYLETPSALREQVTCPVPFDPAQDFHFFFCFTSRDANTIHLIRKSAQTVAEFCSCPSGKLAAKISHLVRTQGDAVEMLLPGLAKTTRVYFRNPLQLRMHESFAAACASGHCAYAESIREIRRWSSFPLNLIAPRFRELRALLQSS